MLHRSAISMQRRWFTGCIIGVLAFTALSCANSEGVSTDDSSTSQVATTDTTPAPTTNRPRVVVTYSVLGAFVERLVGDTANVMVLIPDGQDPHDFEPSPRDIEAINEAELVVANGLNLEEGLDDALRRAAQAGTSVFYVADHVQVLDVVDVNDHSAHGHSHTGAQSDHSHDGHSHSDDPHVWLSPATMLEALPALTAAASDALRTDLTARSRTFADELTAIDAELRRLFAALPDCQLVTGHNELGYFAQRYGCTVIAAILSSPSTTAEESASNVEFVIDVITTHDARAVFTSIGTNPSIAERVADEAGVRLVEIGTHYLGSATSYVEFIRALGTTIVASLR